MMLPFPALSAAGDDMSAMTGAAALLSMNYSSNPFFPYGFLCGITY